MNGFFSTLSSATLDFAQYASGVLALIATLVVAIGLIFEYFGSKSTARANWHPFTGGPPPYWDAGRIGDWLIVVGVVGELLFGSAAFMFTSALDTNRRAQIANADELASHALKSASQT